MANDRARELRKAETEAENVVWKRLRNRRFANFKFHRQVTIGLYIVDFVCFERRLIIEVDGGQHAEHKEYDDRRTKWLQSQGFRVLRFWNNEVLRDWDAVEAAICRALEERS